MDNQSLLKERKELFSGAIAMKKVSRVPLLSNLYTWRIFDAGYNLKEAFADYETMNNVNRICQERYCFDAYMEVGGRNSYLVNKAMGAGFHIINFENDTINIQDHTLMNEDEYSQISDDFTKFVYTKAFKRYAPNLTYEQLENAMNEFLKYWDFVMNSGSILTNEYGVLAYPNMAELPIEQLYYVYRGIKGFSTDMRRHPAEMLEASEKMFVNSSLPMFEAGLEADDSIKFADFNLVMTAQNIMSAKQFEKFYWPHMEKMLNVCIEHGKTMFTFVEGQILPKADFINEIPKGTLLMALEMDDIFETRKTIPNAALMGGLTQNVLKNLPVAEAIDYAKNLIDTLGVGYVMSQNKMVSFKGEIKRENLEAINKFALNYRV